MAEDDPFAEAGMDGDDFNPFSDEMFSGDKKPSPKPAPARQPVPPVRTQPPPRAPSPPPPKPAAAPAAEPDKTPAWANPPPAEPKSDPVAPAPATVEVALDDEEVPAWATTASSLDEKSAKQKPKPVVLPKRPSGEKETTGLLGSATGASSYSGVSGSSQMNEPLLPAQAPKDPNYRPPNFPPFPTCCPWPLRPCFHHDFLGEIPEWGYNTTRAMYFMWYALGVVCFWNFVALCVGLDCKDSKCVSPEQVIFAFIYLAVMVPCAYMCWFQPLYTGMRKDSAMRFGIFFLVFFIQFLVVCWMSINPNNMGSAGIINSTNAIGQNKIVGIIMFSACAMWIIWGCSAFVMLQRVLVVFRSSGHTVQAARDEASQAGFEAGYKAAQSELGKQALKGAVAGV